MSNHKNLSCNSIHYSETLHYNVGTNMETFQDKEDILDQVHDKRSINN